MNYRIYVNLCLQSSIKYVPGKPNTVSGDVNLILPFEKLSNVKFDYKASLLCEKNDDYDLQGSSTLTYNDDKTIKLDGGLKSSGIFDGQHLYEYDVKLTATVLKNPPITLHDQFKYEPADGKVKVTYNTAVSSGEKEVKLTVDPLIYDEDLTHVDLKAKASTPYEKLRNINLDLQHQVTFN